METLWRVDKVAAVVDVSIQTIYRYVANKQIPFHKLGGSVRFSPTEIQTWLKSRKGGNEEQAITSN